MYSTVYPHTFTPADALSSPSGCCGHSAADALSSRSGFEGRSGLGQLGGCFDCWELLSPLAADADTWRLGSSEGAISLLSRVSATGHNS